MTKRKYLPLKKSWCIVCEKTFKTSRSHALYCSDRCRKRASRAGKVKQEQTVTGVTIAVLEKLSRRYGF